MAQQPMYPAIANSPGTELSGALTAVATTVAVTDATKLPPAPSLLTIGTDENAETVLYTGKTGNSLTGCTRGFDGTTAKSWVIGSKVARYYTAYDHEAFRSNLTGLSGVTNEATTDIILSAGQQILNATKNARLQGLKVQGRTLIDLLGGAGSGESLAGWSLSGGTLPTLSSAQRRSGNSSFRLSSGATDGSYMFRDVSVPLAAEKQYVLCVWAYVESWSSTTPGPSITVYDYGIMNQRYQSYGTASAGIWQLLTIKIPTNSTVTTTKGLRVLLGTGSPGASVAYYDEVRIYEVSAADYAAIETTITGEAIDRFLPYVPPGINGVDGLWVRRYGKNLLPGTPDVLNVRATMTSPYDMTLTTTAATSSPSYIDFPVVAGKRYVFSMDNVATGGYADANFLDGNNGGVLRAFSPITGGAVVTAIAPAGAEKIRIYFSNTAIGTFIFRNWQLENGSTATPFQPREDSLIAFSGVELHANPSDGSDPDVLREVNGRYEVTRKVRKMVLDGSLVWVHHVNFTGYKQLRLPITNATDTYKYPTLREYVTDYSGRLFGHFDGGEATIGAYFSTINAGNLYLMISNADSGWGDSYTPTADEIKAYFNGWRMFNAASGVATNPYNGTAGQTKGWVEMWSAGNPTVVVPTVMSTGWTPYQLLYRLASPITETVQEDGSLSLLEGDNFIEVGSGYVSRERANPNVVSGYAYINASDNAPTKLEYVPDKLIGLFESGLPFSAMNVFKNVNSNGNFTIQISSANFDPAASYSVSYIKLDKSPVPSVMGSYAATEKSQLHDLTDGVSEALARVSVVEAKKAEKDAPAWIAPTLLNGWTNIGGVRVELAYRKDAAGLVHIRGEIKGGVVATAPIFKLPEGYRPIKAFKQSVNCWNGSAVVGATLIVHADGSVILSDGSNIEISLGNIEFSLD